MSLGFTYGRNHMYSISIYYNAIKLRLLDSFNLTSNYIQGLRIFSS